MAREVAAAVPGAGALTLAAHLGLQPLGLHVLFGELLLRLELQLPLHLLQLLEDLLLLLHLLLAALLQLLDLVFGERLPLDELQGLQLGALDGADALAQLVELALRLLHDAV